MVPNSHLNIFLKHLHDNIPFYSRKIPNTIKPGKEIDCFLNIPIISKRDIIENLSSFISSKLAQFYNDILNEMKGDNYIMGSRTIRLKNGKFLYLEKTSGSTGTPLCMVKTLDERFALGNILWKLRKYHDPFVNPNNFLMFIHQPEMRIYNVDLNNTRKENIVLIKDFFLKNNFRWWHISPHQMESLDKYFSDCNVNIEYIESTGIYISDSWRRKYEQYFKCKIINNYGCREIWTIAYDCINQHLHLTDEKYNIIELVDKKGNIIHEDNIVGSVVVTSLILKTMPIVRYAIGDLAYYESGNCECGLNTKRLHLLEGRESQKIYGESNLFGNVIFRRVLNNMHYKHCLSKYDSVRIIQIEKNKFNIYVYDYTESKEIFTKTFINISQRYLKNKYEFVFIFALKGDKSNTKETFFHSEVWE